jgi:hypothetical protein
MTTVLRSSPTAYLAPAITLAAIIGALLPRRNSYSPGAIHTAWSAAMCSMEVVAGVQPEETMTKDACRPGTAAVALKVVSHTNLTVT